MQVRKIILLRMSRRIKEMLLYIVVFAVCTGLITAANPSLRTGYERATQAASNNIEKTRIAMNSVNADCNRYFTSSGHTIKIISSKQQTSEFLNSGAPEYSFPESMVISFCKSDLQLVNVCPVLRKRVFIPEIKRTAFILGIGDEVNFSLSEKILKKPLSGTVAIGHELHQVTGVKSEDKISVLGKTFIVQECRSELGSREDITICMGLEDAQMLFMEKDRINEILATASESPEVIQSKLKQITESDLKVIQQKRKALALLESRDTMKKAADEAVKREESYLSEIKKRTVIVFNAIFVSMIIVAVVWTAFLINSEFKKSSHEIAVLYSIGIKKIKITGIFVTHYAIIGLSGAVIGASSGLLLSKYVMAIENFQVSDILFAAMVTLMLPVLSAVVSIISGWRLMRSDSANLFKSI